MQPKHNKQLVPFARQLRKKMTKEERHLWYDFLRSYPVRFSRQKILGKYIADFYCAEAKLVIELDGSQHYEDSNVQKDAQRSEFLKEYSLKIIRIPNNEVNSNFRGVCEYIDIEVKQSLSHFAGKRLELNAVFGRVYAFEITSNITAMKCTKTPFAQGSLGK